MYPAFIYYKYIDIIRENITPRGDGNLKIFFIIVREDRCHKREYNSERRRKLEGMYESKRVKSILIRENITPRGDGNIKATLIIMYLI